MAPYEIERSDGARMLRVGVDIGGAFTDFAAWREGDRGVFTTEAPSTPPCLADALKAGFEEVLSPMHSAPEEPVYVMHGTTVSTNSIIER
ncbi:MAG TPA: hydantoinase/oxoprolinase N-terminal domain-containing protein, partial [bacterium]|nr:hydantoinase/oxoprolinase N-terminal domain-containing protein [bacterium]